MGMQSKFRQFHNSIALQRYEENATLVEKRDRVLDRLRGAKLPFREFNQGSYAIRTGVKPLDGDFDIDVGIEFDIPFPQQRDPVDVKLSVFSAVFSHTKRVEFRRPCITVYYQHAGEPVYHVDLAVYARDHAGNLYLAVGKQFSSAEQRSWLRSDPKGLCRVLGDRFAGEDAAQFRRVIRYLKRWRDYNFSPEGRAAPVGIGLTAAAHQWFQVEKDFYTGHYDDLGATIRFVSVLLGQFTTQSTFQGKYSRLAVKLPAAPFNDVFEKMTNDQMTAFKKQLDRLATALIRARETRDTAYLIHVFGSDFPR